MIDAENTSGTLQNQTQSQTSEKDFEHDIEDVYKIIGFGKIHWVLLLACGLYVLMVLNETSGMGIISIASQCDFKTDSVDQAVLGSAAFLGIVLASCFSGYLSDTLGRRTILLYTTLAGNLMSFISMLLPNYWSFVAFRFLAGIFISGAATSAFAYLGEFFSAFYRPIVINYACLFIGISFVYFPAISWLILSMNWSLNITDSYSFRPWRLNILFYLLPGLIASLMLIFLPESPKYYLSMNKIDEAYKAVDWICRQSKGETLVGLKIHKIKPDSNAHIENLLNKTERSNILIQMWKETRPLFKRPHLFNLLICCVLMMAVYISSSGMSLWYPTIQNRVGLSKPTEESETLCEILEAFGSTRNRNTTLDHCDDTVTHKSLIDSMTVGVAFTIGYLILGVIINPIGRKKLLIGTLAAPGITGIALLWLKEPIAILVSFVIFIAVSGLGISVMSGVVVELMPTYLRAKAVCIVLLMGRTGSIIGSQIGGALLETHCSLTFGLIAGFSMICAALVFLLPI